MSQRQPKRWNFYYINKPKQNLPPFAPPRYQMGINNNLAPFGLPPPGRERLHKKVMNSLRHFLETAKPGDYCYLNGSLDKNTPRVTHWAYYTGKVFTNSLRIADEMQDLGLIRRPDLADYYGDSLSPAEEQAGEFWVEVDSWQAIPNPEKGPGRPGQVLYEVTSTTKNDTSFPIPE